MPKNEPIEALVDIENFNRRLEQAKATAQRLAAEAQALRQEQAVLDAYAEFIDHLQDCKGFAQAGGCCPEGNGQFIGLISERENAGAETPAQSPFLGSS